MKHITRESAASHYESVYQSTVWIHSVAVQWLWCCSSSISLHQWFSATALCHKLLRPHLYKNLTHLTLIISVFSYQCCNKSSSSSRSSQLNWSSLWLLVFLKSLYLHWRLRVQESSSCEDTSGFSVKVSETHCCKNKLLLTLISHDLLGHISCRHFSFSFHLSDYIVECMIEGRQPQAFALNKSSLLFFVTLYAHRLSEVSWNLSSLVFKKQTTVETL